MKPYQCPICLGCGNVPGGFYNVVAGHIDGWISASSSEMCRACNSSGVIYDGGLKECETKEETEKLYQFSDEEDKITVLKDIRGHLLTIIEELQKIGRNV